MNKPKFSHQIIINYLQSFTENGPCIKIKPFHFKDINIFDNDDKIINIICSYLPNIIYNDDENYSAKYKTLPISAKTGQGINDVIQWLYDAIYQSNCE